MFAAIYSDMYLCSSACRCAGTGCVKRGGSTAWRRQSSYLYAHSPSQTHPSLYQAVRR